MANILSAPAPREMQATAQEIFRLIQSEMDAVEEEFEKRARSNIQIITRIGQYLYQTGGKRVRPALLILSAKIFGEDVDAAVIQMATVMEFLHTATLVHDDVIDGAEMRRGCQAVSTEWGNETAVLMGELESPWSLSSTRFLRPAAPEEVSSGLRFSEPLNCACDGATVPSAR